MVEEREYIDHRGPSWIRERYLNDEEIENIDKSLHEKIDGQGGYLLEISDPERFMKKSIYEFPEEGRIEVDFKTISTLDFDHEHTSEPNFNVRLNFIGFDERTRRYATIRKSLDKVLVDFMRGGCY